MEELHLAGVPAQPGPIQLRGSLHETIWGGSRLAQHAGKPITEGSTVGESWETALDAEAVNPPYAGYRLETLVERYRAALIGTQAEAIYGTRFPLLAKFIDASAQLSVQVHPTDDYARQHEGGKLGKTEMWYVLHADPGATLVYGLQRDTTPDEVRRAIAESRLESLLHTFEVQSGDVLFVPAGTVHAIGAGVVLYELQEYSDITYRLYDYGRLQADGQPRQLHIEQSLTVMDYTKVARDRVRPLALEQRDGLMRRALVACRYFALEELRLDGTLTARTEKTSCEILTVLGGRCALTSHSGTLDLQHGQTALLPASLGDYTLTGENLRLLRGYVPLARSPLIARWQDAQRDAIPMSAEAHTAIRHS